MSNKVEFQIQDSGNWKTVSTIPYYQDQKVNSELENLVRTYRKIVRAVQNGMLVGQQQP